MWADGKRVDAFEEMYRRCYPQLVDLCRRTLYGQGDPEAIAQEAFVRAWGSLDCFSGARPFWPWVATIARRLCIDHRRRLYRESAHLHVAATVDERLPVLPDEALETEEDYRSVLVAMRQLKPAEQRVITLRDLNGWSYEEIARFEGVTVESIRGSLKRARASLRRSFAKVVAGAPAGLAWRRWTGLRARVAGRTATMPAPFAEAGQSGLVAQVALAMAAAAIALGAPASETVRPLGVGSTAVVGAGGVDLEVAAPDTGSPSVPDDATAGTSDAASFSGTVPGDVHPQPAGGPLRGLLADGADTPEGVVFSEFAKSPSYERDGTVFAVGTAAATCPNLTCPVLFRSTDRGATWVRLPATGFTGGSILLPPTFPADPRLFVAANNVLQVSNNGGLSFASVAPVGGAAAISPTFAEDHRILLGQAPGWEYRDDLGAMYPSGTVTGSTSLFASPRFSPNYALDGTVFVGGTTPGPTGQAESAVFRCVHRSCTTTGSKLAGVIGTPELAISPRIADDHAVFAWRGDRLYKSSDDARTFAPVALPIPGYVRSVSFGDDGSVWAGVIWIEGGATVGGVLRSTDAGRTWHVVGADTALRHGVETVVALPSGRVLAALAPAGGQGLLCSDDAGATWHRRCRG